MENIARHLIVTFQGPSQALRFETLYQADGRRCGGWVRTLDDQRIEVLLEGTRASVEGLIAWLHVGSPAHRILAVEIRPRRTEGLTKFQVVRPAAELVS